MLTDLSRDEDKYFAFVYLFSQKRLIFSQTELHTLFSVFFPFYCRFGTKNC